MPDETVREILEGLEQLEEDFPEGEEELKTLLIQEEDLAFGIKTFDSAVDKVESHLEKGADIESELDMDQLRDDRSALHERYASGENYNTQFWDTGQMLDDIVQNEDYTGIPDGPLNDLVHMHPNDDGGVLLEKVKEIEDAEISYPDGGTGTVDIDYSRIRQNAKEGAKEAIKEELDSLDKGGSDDSGLSRRDYFILGGVGLLSGGALLSSTYFGLINTAQNEQIKDQNEQQGVEKHATATEEMDGGIGDLPAGYSHSIPSGCGVDWADVTNDVVEEDYVGNEYFPDGQIDTNEIAFKEESDRLHVAAWDHEDGDWENILRYQEGTCQ